MSSQVLRPVLQGELFSHLDAPVARVAAQDTWVAYHPDLEYEILPQVEDLVKQAERVLSYYIRT